jgi:Cu+-exporting ATPase
VEAADAGVAVRLTVPAAAQAGVPTLVTVTLTDAVTGRPVEDLGRSHEVWMHLIATRSDLGTFAHVHPQPTGKAGELTVELTFPTPGRYIVNTEFRRIGEMADIHDRQVITVAGTAPTREQVSESAREVTHEGVHVELLGTAHAGASSELTFAFTDAATGEPLRDLKPYLAAAGHVVVLSADGRRFAHEHADVRDDEGRPVFALPNQRFGPELPVHVHFDEAGTYRLWGQFRLADGRVLTVPFTVQAH